MVIFGLPIVAILVKFDKFVTVFFASQLDAMF